MEGEKETEMKKREKKNLMRGCRKEKRMDERKDKRGDEEKWKLLKKIKDREEEEQKQRGKWQKRENMQDNVWTGRMGRAAKKKD